MESEVFDVVYFPATESKGQEFKILVRSTGKIVFLAPEKAKEFMASCMDDMIPVSEED